MSDYETFSFSVQLKTKKEKIELECKDCEEKQYEMKESRAVALIGDRFYHDAFLPAEELEKAHKGWENTLHDINHQGTTDVRGMYAQSNILYFIGYNDNVTYDKNSKGMSMDIHVCDNTHYASAWKGYIELCEKSGQTPNVSVSFRAKTKAIKVSDLPEGVDYRQYGLSADDRVRYIYDIQPEALSTVFQGACNDKDGCGIGKQCSKEEVPETKIEDTISEEESQKREEIITWLKNHEKKEENRNE